MERRLRRAVTRRQYDALIPLLMDLRRTADEHAATLAERDPLRRMIARWAIDLIEWARVMLASQRQNLTSEMACLPLVTRYLDISGQHAGGVSIDL